MNQPPASPRVIVGLTPWLPWPLSAWPWWTEPVRAERLALLRIGIALCLLGDVLYHYAFNALTYFGSDGLGEPSQFEHRFRAHRAAWSLLRGVGDDVIVYLSLAILVAMTVWILGNAALRILSIRQNRPADDRGGIALAVWSFALLLHVAGFWARMIDTGKSDSLAWVIPLAGFTLCCLFNVLELGTRLLDRTHRVAWPALLFPLLLAATLLVAGWRLAQMDEFDKTAWWVRVLQSWQNDETLIVIAMGMWIAFGIMLLLGCCTRFAAVMTWMFSMSFSNAHPSLENAGDTIRMILLFYVMLCPCGAVWSVDAWRAKRSGPVFVPPWPIRLIFVQMILIYFMNGMYKLLGDTWQEGDSLYYVLGDLAVARFSPFTLPIPYEATRAMTWFVMVWEVAFPLLVIWRWTRRVALCFGVMFHLGIFATMELGAFVPYALCMYLPLCWWGEET